MSLNMKLGETKTFGMQYVEFVVHFGNYPKSSKPEDEIEEVVRKSGGELLSTEYAEDEGWYIVIDNPKVQLEEIQNMEVVHKAYEN